MGRLADALDAAEQAVPVRRVMAAPTGWEPGVRFDKDSGRPVEVTTEQVARDVQGDPSQWAALTAHLLPMVPAGYVLRLVEARYDPVAWTRAEAFTRTGDAETKTPATTQPAWRYRFRIVPDDTAVAVEADTKALVELIKSTRSVRPRRKPVAAARVVVPSDIQAGKVDAGGGTDELIARVTDKIDKLDALLRDEPAERLVIADPGDIIENFMSTTQQTHTNDRSLPDQLQTARAILTDMVSRLSARAKTTRVLTVPSNHGAWRSSMGESGRAGRPGDDFGIDVHRSVAEKHQFARKRNVTFVIPDPWVESLAIEVVPGFVLGLVHGHQWRPGKASEWWRGQSLGDGPTAAAHVLVHGHYHSAYLEQAGYLDGKPRWIIGVDPLDGGSSWWTNLKGDRSEPSVTTFVVTDDGRWDRYRRIT